VASSLRRSDAAVAVSGLAPLLRALKQVEGDAGKNLRRELAEIAKDVRTTASAGVSHKTGRHGKGPRLAQSIKSRATATGASVYSDAPHAIVQDVGGRVGRGHLTLLKRSEVSRYMTEAVHEARPYIDRRMTELLNEFGHEFER
jgi:hypothetical protein